MEQSAAFDMKTRMRADLTAALKGGRAPEAKLIRLLIAAIDNAEAPPARDSLGTTEQHQFLAGSAEVERLSLTQTQVQAVLQAEIREREDAAGNMLQCGREDRANALRSEAALVARYIA